MIQRVNKGDAKLFGCALRILSRREFNRSLLVDALINKGFEEVESISCAKYVESLGLVSDRRYVDAYINSNRHKYGCRKIIYELKRKGITGDELARAEKFLKSDDEENASLVWKRKYGAQDKKERNLNREVRFLVGRGFKLETATKLVFKNESGE